MSRRRRPREVFLSHSSRNRKFAIRLADTLRAHGVQAWYSERSIVGAQQWHDEIGQALQRCDWFAIVLSPAAVNATWVKHELLYALNDRRYRERIVPILYAECAWKKLSWTLDAIQRVDFTPGFDAGCEALLRIWGIDYQPPAPKRRVRKKARRRKSSAKKRKTR